MALHLLDIAIAALGSANFLFNLLLMLNFYSESHASCPCIMEHGVLRWENSRRIKSSIRASLFLLSQRVGPSWFYF